MTKLGKFLWTIVFAMGLISTSVLCADMKVTFENATTKYDLYFKADYSVKVAPGESYTFNLTDHSTTVIGMDYSENPTPWVKYGLGYGGVSYSVDPNSGQSNFSVGLGPASVGNPRYAPPHITLSGGVNMEGTDNWQTGISLQPHGTNNPTTVKFTE